MADNIKNETPTTNASTMKKRWILTINNPIFADSNYTEIDPNNTDLEIIENNADYSIIDDPTYQDCFEYKYIAITKDDKQVAVKRPFFKNQDCIKNYFQALQDNGGLKYAIYQYERGENGTPHIQGFIIYKNSKRFVNVKQDFPTAHIIIPKGTNADNRNYCTKKETRIAEPVEIGEFAEMRARTDIQQFFDVLKLGGDNMLLKNMFPVLYSQYGPEKIERFRQDELKAEYSQKFRDVKVTYIYGKPRTGKTTYIYNNNNIKDICRVDNYTQGTFETYEHQKILVLDEFTGKIGITLMNNLLDKFPVQLPARFTNRTACYDQVYIISNLPLERLYLDEQNNARDVYNAFVYRIHNIIHFTDLGVWHYEKKDGKPVNQEQVKLVPIPTPDDMPF